MINGLYNYRPFVFLEEEISIQIFSWLFRLAKWNVGISQVRNTAQSSCPVGIVSCRQYTDIVVLSDIYKRIAAFCQLTKILDYRLLKCFFYTLLYNASEENPDEWAAFQNEALNKDCPYQIVPIMIVCLMFND